MEQFTHYFEEEKIITPDLSQPEKGKAWRRKSDGLLFQNPMYLGKLYFLNGERLAEPIDEKPEDFELVDLKDYQTEDPLMNNII